MKNWKTTCAGWALSALTLMANGTSWKQMLVALGIGILGTVAKDSNVTGGTVVQH